jgi:hypothetical protein
MTLLNGLSCSVISITLSALTLSTLLRTSKNILTEEHQDKALKMANVIILTSGLIGYYHGYYSKILWGNNFH